jgi:hypothetical protein
MKKKNFVWAIGVFSVMFWACEKESLVQQSPVDMPDEISALLSAEQIQDFEQTYELAFRNYAPRYQVIPLYVRMDALVSRGAFRLNEPGGDVSDYCILGKGLWSNGDRANYFEAVHFLNPQEFKGEGWLEEANPGAKLKSALYFTSEAWNETIYQKTVDQYRLDATLRIFRGTGDYLHAFGEASRHVFFEEGDYVNGIAIIYGYIVIPGPEELHWDLDLNYLP